MTGRKGNHTKLGHHDSVVLRTRTPYLRKSKRTINIQHLVSLVVTHPTTTQPISSLERTG